VVAIALTDPGGGMDILLGKGLSLVDFAFYSTLFVMMMVSFLSREITRAKVLSVVWAILFAIAAGVALVSSKPYQTKIFVSLLVLSAIVVSVSITIVRRADRLVSKQSRY